MRKSPSIFVFLAGSAAAAALLTGLGMKSPEHHEEPANESPAPAKAKIVKATPKAHAPAAKEEASPAEAAQASEHEPEEKTAQAPAKVKESRNARAVANEEVTDAEGALARLQDGNARWVSDSETNPHTDPARRKALAEAGQKPFVTVLTCADSRIPVERIFDQGVGDVFVIRVAGNVAGVSETGTIEYGTGHLKTPLLVVMGHTKCGAVGAAATHAPVHGMVAKLVDSINPAVERVKRNNPGIDDKELAALTVKENVWQSVFDLYKNSSEVREMVASGKLKVVGAVYDIASGKVDFLGEHPWQNELLSALAGKTESATAAAEPAGHETHEAAEHK